ncbi:hypothetical protein J1N35_020989 [Gossypium stocksii]|uniref:Aminotransferase-like plant mobile domain-containing protein n=1 Tax=Gossypium stocksii TaxID=47602 RepID=A0A9D3VDK7_9ROSI|nr:hypothetical protein J1N35_020989 [Gossypium stocksii]
MALIRTFELRANLISVLVERWRLETHAFHLSCRKCTITLKDVALQLGLPVDNAMVTVACLYSWGSAVLATLYCELCQATKHDTQYIVEKQTSF